MPTFFHQSLLLRTSRTAARLMRKTFNEMLEHHSNFGDSPVTPYEMIRTA